MTTHLWLVIDHNPTLSDRRPPELVICGADRRPNEVACIPLTHSQTILIRPQDYGPISAMTDTFEGCNLAEGGPDAD